MSGQAIWHRLAEDDLAEAYLHLGADSPAAAERLLDAVERAIAVLLARPRAGRERRFRAQRARGVRSWVVRGFENYLIFYKPRRGGIDVVRFVHGARDFPNLLAQWSRGTR